MIGFDVVSDIKVIEKVEERAGSAIAPKMRGTYKAKFTKGKDASVSRRKGRPSAEETKERQQAVLEAAREEFSARGYHLTTMDVIASRAGVSKRSLYIWHVDKASLFHACVVEAAKALPLPPLDPRGPLGKTLSTYALAVLDLLCTDYAIGMAGLLMREGRDFPEISRAVEQGQRYLSDPVSKFFRARGLKPKVADQLAAYFMTLLLTGIQRTIILGLAPNVAEEKKRALKFMIPLFLNGAGAWLIEGGIR